MQQFLLFVMATIACLVGYMWLHNDYVFVALLTPGLVISLADARPADFRTNEAAKAVWYRNLARETLLYLSGSLLWVYLMGCEVVRNVFNWSLFIAMVAGLVIAVKRERKRYREKMERKRLAKMNKAA